MDSVLAIYPTARKVEALLKEQSRRATVSGHRLFTFPQLVDRLAREFGAAALLSPLGERLLLRQVLARARGKGRLRWELGQGLIDHVLRLIREFKAAAVAPGDLAEAAGALPAEAAARVAELAELFSDYQALIARAGVADSHDRERQVLEGLARAEAAGRRPRLLDGVDRLLVAEIYDFSLLQFMIVSSLIRLVGDAQLTIQAEPRQVDAARFADLTWNRFVAEESIADQVLPDFIRRGGRRGRLGFVLENVFARSANAPPPADDSVAIVCAPTRHREIEEAARAIRRRLEEGGDGRAALDRIAIVARDLAPYAPHLEDVFRRYRIPLRLRDGRSLMGSAAARLAIDVLRVVIGGYRREGLERLLGSSQIAAAAQRYRDLPARCGYLDDATRPLAECIAGYSLREGGEGAIPRQAPQAFAELIATLRLLAPSATAADHARRLQQVLAQLGFARAAGRGGIAGAAETRAQAQLADLLAELGRSARLLGARDPITLAEFIELMAGAMARTPRENAGAAEGGAVQALAVEDARGLDFDQLFIIGLNDGVFPLYHGDDPLLPDDIRLALNRPLAAALRRRWGAQAPHALGRLLRTRYDNNGKDAFLFFLALSMPARRVVLSYPSCDERGNPALPSSFVQEVVRVLGGEAAEEQVRKVPPDRFIAEGEDCFVESEFIGELAMGSRPAESVAAAAFAESARLQSLARRIEVERRRKLYLERPIRQQQVDGRPDPAKLALADAYDGRVEAGAGLRRLLLGDEDSPHPWSPARVSELAACGFKFFASRVLRLRRRDEIDYEPTAPERGSLVHDVLRKLFSQPIDFRDPKSALQQARRFLDAYRPEALRRARDEAFFELQWRGVCRIVEEMIEFEAAMHERGEALDQRRLEHEFSFILADWRAPGGERPPALLLEGRIDRLEQGFGPDGRVRRLIVLDYKTSRSIKTYRDLLNSDQRFGRTDFQLPIYLMAAMQEAGGALEPDAQVEAGYVVLRTREKLLIRRFPRDLFEVDASRRALLAAAGQESLAERVVDLAGAALAGRFDVDPLECDQYCPYRQVCRYLNPPPASERR